MKKFVPIVFVTMIMMTAVSCREVDELTQVAPNKNFSAKIVNDTIPQRVALDGSSAGNDNSQLYKDPPVKKDTQGW